MVATHGTGPSTSFHLVNTEDFTNSPIFPVDTDAEVEVVSRESNNLNRARKLVLWAANCADIHI